MEFVWTYTNYGAVFLVKRTDLEDELASLDAIVVEFVPSGVSIVGYSML